MSPGVLSRAEISGSHFSCSFGEVVFCLFLADLGAPGCLKRMFFCLVFSFFACFGKHVKTAVSRCSLSSVEQFGGLPKSHISNVFVGSDFRHAFRTTCFSKVHFFYGFWGSLWSCLASFCEGKGSNGRRFKPQWLPERPRCEFEVFPGGLRGGFGVDLGTIVVALGPCLVDWVEGKTCCIGLSHHWAPNVEWGIMPVHANWWG